MSNVLKRFNEEHASTKQIANLRIRVAVRVVLIDDTAKIAIIHVKKHDYYSLPGGGVEKDTSEGIHEALVRETREETGCDIEVLGELGIVEEVRLQNNLLNRSYGFLAKVKGAKQELVLNQNEVDEGFALIWVGVDEAIKLVGTYPHSLNLYYRYFLQRELTFLEQAKLERPELFQ
jgi:8-oxo-dGTP diphosphatase